MPAQQYDRLLDITFKIQHPSPQVSVYVDLLSTVGKFNQFKYLGIHTLGICSTLKDLLEAGHPHIVLDTSPYPSFHDIRSLTAN